MQCVSSRLALVAFCLASCKEKAAVPQAEPAPEPVVAAPEVPATPLPAPPSPTAPPAAAAPLAILPLVADGAHFQFSLRESAAALKLQTDACAAEAKGDVAKAAACLAAVEKQGAGEGIRFEKEGDRLFWVSYGLDAEGKEELFLRGPIALLPSPADELRFQPAGAFIGKQAEKLHMDKALGQLPADQFLSVKAVDARTIVMQTPGPKGALTYHRN